MKSYVIFLFFLFVFSARLAAQHILPVTILPSGSDWLTWCNVIKWHMEIYDAAFSAKRHTRRMDKK